MSKPYFVNLGSRLNLNINIAPHIQQKHFRSYRDQRFLETGRQTTKSLVENRTNSGRNVLIKKLLV